MTGMELAATVLMVEIDCRRLNNAATHGTPDAGRPYNMSDDGVHRLRKSSRGPQLAGSHRGRTDPPARSHANARVCVIEVMLDPTIARRIATVDAGWQKI